MGEEKKLPRVVGYREKKTLKTGWVRRGRGGGRTGARMVGLGMEYYSITSV
jgi:hypothetical protein